MEEEYERLLERYLLKLKMTHKDEDVSNLVRDATTTIKDKLFHYYLKRKGHGKLPKGELSRNKSN